MTRDRRIRFCAQVAHEANRVYCQSLGDYTQADWGSAESWQKESAIKGVEGVLAGNTPKQSHECWLEEKVATGWCWGATKDPGAKTHPCMVPYDELPLEQQAKDELFISTVKAMAAALGLK